MSKLPYQGMMAPAGNITSAETKESENFERSFAQFEKLGFAYAELEQMKDYMEELQRLTAGFDNVYFVPTPTGILLTDGGKNGLNFKPSRLSMWQKYYSDNTTQQGMGAFDPTLILSAAKAIGSSGGGGGAVPGGGAGGMGDIMNKLPEVTDMFSDVFGGVGDLVGSLFGSNRGWYKSNYPERESKMLLKLLRNHAKNINQSVINNDMAKLGKAVANFRLEYKLFLKSAERQKSRDWNTPTENNLSTLISGLKKLIGKIEPALDNWLSKSFNNSGTRGSVSKNSSFYLDLYQKSPFQYDNKVKHGESIPKLSFKPGVSRINSFAITGEGDPISVGGQQTGFFNGENKQASLIPGVPNYVLLGGGAVTAGILFFPEIKELIKGEDANNNEEVMMPAQKVEQIN